MKEKKVRDRRSGARTLSIKPGKREDFVYSEAEWLASDPHPNLASFRYTIKGADVALYYDLTGLTDLKSYLKASLAGGQYQGMLVAMNEVLSLCTKLDLPTSQLQFDVEHVFVQPDGTLRFLFVPLTGMSATQDNTPRALLQYLADDSRVSFVVPDDSRHAAALFDYVKRNTVFSLASYGEFLSNEFPMAFSGTAQSGQLVGGSGSMGPGSGTGSGGFSTRMGGSSALSGAGAAGVRGNAARIGMGGAAAAGSQARVQGTFDPVSLLRNAPAASEVVANQDMPDRVKDAVAGVSPTAAPSGAVAAMGSAPLGEAQEDATQDGLALDLGTGADAVQAARPSESGEGAGASDGAHVRPAKSAPGAAAVSDRAAATDAASEFDRVAGGAAASSAFEEVRVATVQTNHGTASEEQGASSSPAGASVVEASSSAGAPAPSSASPAPVPQAPSSEGTQASSFFSATFPSDASAPNGTTLLGGRAARSAFGAGALAKKPCYLLRERDGSRFPIEGSEALVVGRSAASDIQLAGNSNLSRAHASVRRVGEGFEVTDLGSSNGTFVHGVRLARGQSMRVGLGEEFHLADEPVKIVE